jgi:hypothetical protein
MLRIDSYAIYPETDRFHRIRRIAVQPFVACMARPLSLRLSLPLNDEAKCSRKNSRHVRMKIIHVVTSLRLQAKGPEIVAIARWCSPIRADLQGLLERRASERTKPAEARTRHLGGDAQNNGIGVLLRTTATTSCDPARLGGSMWLQPCRSTRPGGCARCLPPAARAPPPPSRGARPKKRSAAA